MGTVEITRENRPFIDLVQIRCDGSFGSGLLVGQGIVLTALHCVADPDQRWRDRGPVGVYLWRDLYSGQEREYPGRIAWPAERRSPADLAVVVIDGEDAPQSQLTYDYHELPLGEVAVSARGFPKAAAGTGLPGGRVEILLAGSASFAQATTRTILFTSHNTAATAGRAAWGGLSGGPLFIGELLLGVMREVPEGWDGTKTLAAEPLPALLQDQANGELRRLLSVKLPLSAGPQPAPYAPDPEYQLLWEYVYTLDRDDEVARAVDGIRPHVGRRPIELLISGHPEDLCEEFFKRLWRERLAPRDQGRNSIVGTPPAPIPWPPLERGIEAAIYKLAADTLSSLGLQPGWSSDLSEVRTALEKAVQPPWICIRLPSDPTPEDIVLLEKWRDTWAELSHKDNLPLGYALLYTASAELPPRLRDGRLATGLGSANVALREISLAEVDRWQEQIQALEQSRSASAGSPQLSLIAYRVAMAMRQQQLATFRLETVRRLLAGTADWHRSVA